jgi:hypothetical protein
MWPFQMRTRSSSPRLLLPLGLAGAVSAAAVAASVVQPFNADMILGSWAISAVAALLVLALTAGDRQPSWRLEHPAEQVRRVLRAGAVSARGMNPLRRALTF